MGLHLPVFRLSSVNAFEVARALVLVEMFAITFSPALVNLIEFCLILTVAFSKSLRSQIVAACKKYLPVRFLFVFIGWMIVATTWGDAPMYDRIHEILSWRKILLFPLILALVSQEFKEKTLIVITSVGMVCALLAWFMAAADGASIPVVLMRSDVVQTIYLSLSVFAVITLVRANFNSMTSLYLSWSFLGVLVLVATIFSSDGRSGYLFFLVGVVCFALSLVKRNRVAIVSSLTILIVGALFLAPKPSAVIWDGIEEVSAIIDPAQNPEYSSMGIRVVMWDHSIEMIANKPIFGSGAGSFETDYSKVAESRSVGWRAGRSNDPHNQFLHIAAEYGLVGLMLLAAFIGSLIHSLRIDPFSIFGLSVLLGFCATSFFNGHLSSLVEGRMFWILVPLFLCPRLATVKPVLEVNR